MSFPSWKASEQILESEAFSRNITRVDFLPVEIGKLARMEPEALRFDAVMVARSCCPASKSSRAKRCCPFANSAP